MSLKDAYEKLLDKADQELNSEAVRGMKEIYPEVPEAELNNIYKKTLPIAEEEARDLFKEAVELLEDHTWKKTNKSFTGCLSHVENYHEYSETDKVQKKTIVGDLLTVWIPAEDLICQIKWPDGTVHIFNSDITYSMKILDKDIGILDAIRELYKRHMNKREELGKKCRETAKKLFPLQAGSDEYVKLRIYANDEPCDFILFRDGNAYGVLPADRSDMTETLSAAIRDLNLGK